MIIIFFETINLRKGQKRHPFFYALPVDCKKRYSEWPDLPINLTHHKMKRFKLEGCAQNFQNKSLFDKFIIRHLQITL